MNKLTLHTMRSLTVATAFYSAISFAAFNPAEKSNHTTAQSQCDIPTNTLNAIFGEHTDATLTNTFPLFNLSEQPDVEQWLWVNHDSVEQGLYQIEMQNRSSKATIIASHCGALTPTLMSVLESARAILGEHVVLSPTAHFVDDMGLSFDQIIELHSLAYTAAGKAMPDDLYETFLEISTAIDKASIVKSRDIGNQKYHLQTIFYSTTRALQNLHGTQYSGDRDTHTPLHFGRAVVSIPSNHTKGEIEQPFFSIKWLENSEDHVLIKNIDEMSRDDFWQAIPTIQGNDVWKDSVIVYIHGYNVAFNSAVKRTAQMAYDFEYTGVPILFSWPSNAALLDYASDREDAIWSATYLAAFLTELRQNKPTTNIHIVAHSMGNQVLVNALNELSFNTENQAQPFTSVILAAPDVDSEWFSLQLAPRVTRLAKHWALYTSENDGALIASNKVNQAKRLGMPGTHIDNIDIIDTSGLNAAPWSIPESHSYYANKLPVIEDLVQHLKGIPPSQRALIENKTEQGITWEMQEE